MQIKHLIHSRCSKNGSFHEVGFQMFFRRELLVNILLEFSIENFHDLFSIFTTTFPILLGS